jgi:hypothetical protein
LEIPLRNAPNHPSVDCGNHCLKKIIKKLFGKIKIMREDDAVIQMLLIKVIEKLEYETKTQKLKNNFNSK